MEHAGIHQLDLNRLNEYSRRMAELLIPAFPDETLHSVMHSEDFFMPQGDRLVGAWVAEWLNPFETCEWGCNLMVSTEERMITVRWLGDTQHFANWDRVEDDPDLKEAKAFLTGIFAEKLWYVSAENSGYGRIIPPEEIAEYVAESGKSSYIIESWRGTYNATKQK